MPAVLFGFGCDIEKWTKDTTIDEQARLAETLQKQIKKCIKKLSTSEELRLSCTQFSPVM